MPAPHSRQSRPYDPEDRDGLDQRPKLLMIMAGPLMGGPRAMIFMQGDFWRVVKVFGVLVFGFVSYIRFTSATPLLTISVVVFALLAIAAVRASAISTIKRLDFVRANEFANPDDFIRRAKSLHIAEVAAAAFWIIWLGFSFGRFDWIPIAIAAVAAVIAFIQRSRLAKISQPRNMWEK